MTKLDELKTRVTKLESTIVDTEARAYFLRLPKNWLDDVERRVAPGIETSMLPIIDKMLASTEELVAKYGRNIRVVG